MGTLIRVTPESSQIKQIAYDDDKLILVVKFRNSRVYQYDNVPLEIWNGVNKAEPVGTYFNIKIRNKFEYKEL